VVKQDITLEVMEFMVWVVELVAHELFNNNKHHAYNVLYDQGIWDMYIQNYDITHSLSASNIICEIKEVLTAKEVI